MFILICLVLIALLVAEKNAWSLEYSVNSPNNRYELNYYSTIDEGGGHAPYGQNVFLRKKHFASFLFRGDVVFAAYCGRDTFNIRWEKPLQITIICQNKKEDAHKTVVTKVKGIDVVIN